MKLQELLFTMQNIQTNELLEFTYYYILTHKAYTTYALLLLFFVFYFFIVIIKRKKYIKDIKLTKIDYLNINKNSNIYKDQETYTQKEIIKRFRNIEFNPNNI